MNYITDIEIEERVKEIICEMLGSDESEVTNEALFTNLGGDSLDAIEVIMYLEKEYDIIVEYTDFNKTTTVCNIIEYVKK